MQDAELAFFCSSSQTRLGPRAFARQQSIGSVVFKVHRRGACPNLALLGTRLRVVDKLI